MPANPFPDVTPATRNVMRANKGKDTKPEMAVRRMLHAMGYRYRLHRRDLPGTPDLAFPARRKVVFVHGCFWHGHCCQGGRLPKTRPEFWEAKLGRNRARDAGNVAELHQLGWRSMVVWECELTESKILGQKLRAFLQDGGPEAGHGG